MIKKILLIIALMTLGATMPAQNPSSGIPRVALASDASIIEMNHATLTLRSELISDSATLRVDTVHTVSNIEWRSPAGTGKKRMARRRLQGSDFYDFDRDRWLDIWWFTFKYPSINAKGEPVLLTAMACMPDEDCTYVNNVIIGCHVTITSNKECPSMYNHGGSSLSDVSMIMNHAGSGLVFHSSQDDYPYYNLVILPDYEGYGLTSDTAHPYLYQELTARQVVDATRYGIALYKNSSEVSSVRHPFRSGWRTISLGYSQGGSVALATHRFIEQNNLSQELQFAGSVCGDGPYDLMSTLMYYTAQSNQGTQMSMPVVLPLILKGMCDANPYMKNHQVSDYLTERFLETGIIDLIAGKEHSTDDITEHWKDLYKNGKNGDKTYFQSVLTSDGKAYLANILKPAGLQYFRNLYNQNPNYTSAAGIPLPTHRGVMEDLHLALESNNMTAGWQPQHSIYMYHSTGDTVVPLQNRTRAVNTLGSYVVELSPGVNVDHVGTGREFFLGTEETNAIRALSTASY